MRLVSLARRNFKENYRDRMELGFLLAFPIVLMLIFGTVMGGIDFFEEAGIDPIDLLAPGVMVMGMSFLTMFASRLMMADRERGFLSRLMTTPARPFDFIIGYSLTLVIIALALIILYMAMSWLLGMKVTGDTTSLLFLVIFLTSLNAIALGMIIASLVKSQAQAENLSFLIVFPPIMLAVTMMMAEELVPSAVASLIYAFPFFRAIDTAIGVNVMGLGLEAIRTDLLFLAGFAVVFFAIGIFLFRNCLVISRLRSILSYVMAAALFGGLLGFGFFGGDLRVSHHVSAEAFGMPPFEAPPGEPHLLAPYVSFPEDFEDGKAEGWRLDPGWEVRLDDDNHVLSGSSNEWSAARPEVAGWFDYTLETRVKLITPGWCEISFRASDIPFRSRYFLGMDERGFGLNREMNGDFSHLTNAPPGLALNKWHQIKITVKGNNISVYVDGELKLDYTDGDRPLIFGGFSFAVGPDTHALFDDVDVHVTDPVVEAQEYLNEEYGFSVRYPAHYVAVEPTEPEQVFKAHSTARAPVPLPQIAIYAGEGEERITLADLRELMKATFEALGATNIEFVSEKETTLRDGITPAYELVLERSMVGTPRLKTLMLSVIKKEQGFSIILTDMADYWSETEAELIEIAYSLKVK